MYLLIKPLYLQPLYQERIALGKEGFPFNQSNITYEQGLCPVTEKMHYDVLVIHEFIRPGMSTQDLDDVVEAFQKVWINKKELM